MIDLAIVVQLGFTQRAEPSREFGLYALHDRLAERYFDRRSVWLGLRTWNADMKQTAHVILHRKPAKIIHVGFSYGCGEGLIQFAKHLRRRAVGIDLAILIDPVVRYRFLKPLSMLANHSFRVPENVRAAQLWRTVNWPSFFSPWGRNIEPRSSETEILKRIVYGSAESLAKYDPPGEHRQNADVWHTNIDEFPDVHRDVLSVVQWHASTWIEQAEG